MTKTIENFGEDRRKRLMADETSIDKASIDKEETNETASQKQIRRYHYGMNVRKDYIVMNMISSWLQSELPSLKRYETNFFNFV